MLTAARGVKTLPFVRFPATITEWLPSSRDANLTIRYRKTMVRSRKMMSLSHAHSAVVVFPGHTGSSLSAPLLICAANKDRVIATGAALFLKTSY